MKVSINTPFVFRHDKKYRYVLEKPLSFTLIGTDFGEHRFEDEKGHCWLYISKDTWLILSGYAWDGASMAPDFRKCLLGTLVHDVGYQFLHIPCFPLTRIQVDKLFDAIMKHEGFWLSWIYSRAVMLFGGIHRNGTKNRHGHCTIRHRNTVKGEINA